jgi:hypothetical protein
MFTGSYSYRSMARMVFRPASVVKLFMALFRESLGVLSRNGSTGAKRLHIGSSKVLILGSGFGGTYALRYLVPHLNRNENVETTMVSDENFFLFSPLLHEVAMGGIETRHIAYPIRRLHWRDRFNFVQAVVERIDLSGHKVSTTAGILEFDYLVLALGSVTDMSQLDSAGEKSEHTRGPGTAEATTYLCCLRSRLYWYPIGDSTEGLNLQKLGWILPGNRSR